MKLYSNESVDKLMQKYIERGGEVKTIDEGSLVLGLVICYGEGLKFCVIKEKYLNEWSSANTVQFFNRTPKKYAHLLNI